MKQLDEVRRDQIVDVATEHGQRVTFGALQNADGIHFLVGPRRGLVPRRDLPHAAHIGRPEIGGAEQHGPHARLVQQVHR